MSVRVLYFASLREQVGRDGDRLDLDRPVPVRELWRAANGERAMPDNLLMAINQEYVAADALVRDGDEVAFFPPVTGG